MTSEPFSGHKTRYLSIQQRLLDEEDDEIRDYLRQERIS
ncbi:hypothetical protein SAMN05216167_1356 [Spirosoma endophyticum]|uniref:Uncharacterized protein n=1 Tax=Spirosoma endophyticum TaxID=662367 RepID=A0A1I2GTE4_9BACT|nr:hypothetical protein SAMN05216167_1356 [Spirosoma endophyticum]